MNTLLIFIGAGIGGVCRFWISNISFLLFGRAFPYGTLIVNILACFAMGFMFTLLIERYYSIAPQLRALVLVGFLGGFSTFSAFTIETFNLYESGAVNGAFINIVANVVLCMIAVWMGVMGGKHI